MAGYMRLLEDIYRFKRNEISKEYTEREKVRVTKIKSTKEFRQIEAMVREVQKKAVKLGISFGGGYADRHSFVDVKEKSVYNNSEIQKRERKLNDNYNKLRIDMVTATAKDVKKELTSFRDKKY